MTYTWIVLLIIYFVLTHLIAKYIGEKREIGYGESVFWSVLLSPLVGFVVTLLSPALEE